MFCTNYMHEILIPFITYWCVLFEASNYTDVSWVLFHGFPSFQGANLLLVLYYSMLSAAAMYNNYNGMYYIYSRVIKL